jgi:hypothetical protein
MGARTTLIWIGRILLVPWYLLLWGGLVLMVGQYLVGAVLLIPAAIFIGLPLAVVSVGLVSFREHIAKRKHQKR